MYQEVIKQQGETPIRFVSFDSMQEFVEPKNTGKCRKLWDSNVVDKFEAKDKSDLRRWFGAESRDEFDEVLQKGHSRYVDLVRAKDVSVRVPQTLKRKRIRGDFGDEVCIHAINSGNVSSAWIRRSPKQTIAHRSIRLLVNLCQSGSVKAEELQWVGVTALRLSDALEESGYRVAIDAFIGSNHVTDAECISMTIPLKGYDTPMDIQGLSSAVCFPGFFRGPGFMNFGLASGEMSYGLGQPQNDEKAVEIARRFYADPSEQLEVVSNKALSQVAAETEIERIIRKFDTTEAA